MYKIILKKKFLTKTKNNSYNIILNKKNRKLPIGSFSQNNCNLFLDINALITVISKGGNFSENFKKIFINNTGNMLKIRKNIKINY